MWHFVLSHNLHCSPVAGGFSEVSSSQTIELFHLTVLNKLIYTVATFHVLVIKSQKQHVADLYLQ